MAKRKQSRNQQTVQEDAIIKALLMKLQAIAERRQGAVRLHQLMNQRCHREIPVQYERLWRRSPPQAQASTHDSHRGTRKRRRRRLSHARV
jgi:hypothetical protein